MTLTGEAGGNPMICGASIADYCGGLMGCIGTLTGIIDAQRTGHGRRVDASMMDALLLLQENRLSTYLENKVLPKPNGNRYPAASPIGDFMCKDGVPVMMNVSTDAQFKAFAKVFEQPQWLENPHFTSMSLRAEHYLEMEAEVNRVFAELDSAEVVERMQSRKLVYGRINNYEAVVNHPQVEFRKSFVHAVYPDGTSFQVPGNPILMSGMEKENEYATMPLGSNTVEVLSEIADEETVHRIMDPVLEQVAEKTKAMYHRG